MNMLQKRKKDVKEQIAPISPTHTSTFQTFLVTSLESSAGSSLVDYFYMTHRVCTCMHALQFIWYTL